MANKNKKKEYKSKDNSKKYKNKKFQNNDLFQKIENLFNDKQKLIFIVIFSLSTVFSLLLFDMKVSVGGDDAAYIIRAHDFVNKFSYPSFQGALYPFILSVVILIFGISLPILKFLSIIFITAHFYFFYKAFKDNIPKFILFPVLLIISVNAYLLYYGSQTYSEALFVFEQMLLFYLFFRYFITNQNETNIKNDYPKFIILGLVLFVMGLTRSVGYGAFLVVLLYFVIQKNWKSIIYTSASFFTLVFSWEFLKRIIWGVDKIQFSAQSSTLLYKHPYDKTKGKEDILGFVERFIDNSNIYISKHIFTFMGLRAERAEIVPVLTIIMYALFFIAIIWAFRKNKYLLFTGIYLSVMLGITFVMLQKLWDSSRLMIPFFPLTLLFVFSGIYYSLKNINKLKKYQILYLAIAGILFFTTFRVTTGKVQVQRKILQSNLRGNMLAGLTPDWTNYINMCKWAAKNIPKEHQVACRKPSIAFIYTSKRYYGIYKLPSNNADSLLQNLKDNNVRYVIMASLRKYETHKSKFTINTIKRYLYYIQQKYPEKIKVVHQIGREEPAILFEIK